jgi:Fur family transcriptional regulator, iron response regulator
MSRNSVQNPPSQSPLNGPLIAPSPVPVRLRSGDPLSGCPVHELRAKLRLCGLRPTRQRVALGWLLFARGNRHITAEQLFDEANSSRVPISLATVYNTLNQFTQAGLLREIAVDGARTYFDTNTSDHYHFLLGDSNQLMDIPKSQVEVIHLPDVPEGMEIERVDVVVRLRRKIK